MTTPAPSIAPPLALPFTLAGAVVAPATLISDKGGSIIGNNGGGYRLLGTVQESPVASATVGLYDAAGNALMSASGTPLTAITDTQGRYGFTAKLPAENFVAKVSLGGAGDLQAIVPDGASVTSRVDMNLVSTLTTGYILDQYVAPQKADAENVLNKLPATVETDTLAKASLALSGGTVALPPTLGLQDIVATVDDLRAQSGAFDAQMDYVRSLLVIGSLSVAVTDGPALSAEFYWPEGVAVDAIGNLYLADTNNNLIRKFSPAGTVTTLAGNGTSGSADGLGTAAAFNTPEGLAVDASGNLYVADAGNNEIRKITPAGVVTTLAGGTQKGRVNGTGAQASFDWPAGLVLDAQGNLDVTDAGNDLIRQVTPAGVVTTLAGSGQQGAANGVGTAASFHGPCGIARDAAGNLYVADAWNNLIRKVSPGGAVTTLAGSGQRVSADGQGTAASFNFPQSVAVDAQGNVFVADDNLIRKVTPAGDVSTIAGSATQGSTDAVGTAATFALPEGLAIDATGNLYVADTGNNLIRKVSPADVVTTIAGNGRGRLLNGPASVALFDKPFALACDVGGNLYVSDTYNDLIRKVTPDGMVSTLAGSGQFGSANGTGTAASFAYPLGITVDPQGNVFVSDTYNSLIRKVTPGGVVTTAAGVPNDASVLFFPEGIAVDPQGNLYVADTNNFVIRKFTPDGTETTLAGSGQKGAANGLGAAASFNGLAGLALDTAGNLYLADFGNNAIRKITPAGLVSTLAGSGLQGSADGNGTAASFNSPDGIAVDTSGNVYVVDSGNNEIRKITPAGAVTTIAGGPGSQYVFHALQGGIALDPSGDLWVSNEDQIIKVKLH